MIGSPGSAILRPPRRKLYRFVLVLVLCCLVLWYLKAVYYPDLLTPFPIYPSGTGVELVSAPPEDLLYAECLGGFGAIDYQAFTTPDKVEQVKAFYEKVGTQQWLEEVSGGVRFKRFKEQTTICFKGFGRNVHRPTNLVVILDPANPDDSERLGQLYPASLTNHTLLIFVMRGYVSQEG